MIGQQAAIRAESDQRLGRIVIVGGGTAGWMTAASLGWALSALPVDIVLVESEEIGTVGVGEATVPHIRFFNQRLGIDEADFMRRTNATFKLGIEFRDWARIGDSYIHPFGNFGRDIAGLPFHQYWLRLKRAGRSTSELETFSLPILAARADKFAPPVTPFGNTSTGCVVLPGMLLSNVETWKTKSFSFVPANTQLSPTLSE